MLRWWILLLMALVVMGIIACGDSNDGNRANVPAREGVEWIEIGNDEHAAAVKSARAWLDMLDHADYTGS